MSSPFTSRRSFNLLTVASTLLFAATTTTALTEDTHLCGKEQAWSNSDGQYIFNNNAWGDDGSGAECTNVSGDGAAFETIWGWAGNATQTHSYPNVQLNTALFPLQLTKLAAMNLQASWSVTPVEGNNVTENVVYDMFVDTDKTKSASTTDAKYEIMIWIGAFGQPWPLGAEKDPFTGVLNKSLPAVDIASTTFSLYSGNNTGGQIVHSWLALTNQTDFTADVTPLITYLTNNSLVESDGYMGILQFGSETWHSTANVTFNVSSFNLNVTSTDASANAKASQAVSSSTGSSTSTSTPSSTSTSTESSSSASATPSSPSSSSEISSPVTVVLSTSSTPTIALTSSTSFIISTSLRPLSPSSLIPSSTSLPPSSIATITDMSSVPSLTPTSSPGSSSSSSPTGSSGSSGSSIVSLPFWFWEIAAAGCLFAML